MKKNLKQIAVLSVFLGIAAVPVFAAGNSNKANEFERGPFMEHRHGFHSQGNPLPETMGTVVEVNQKNNIITIENADGKKEKIHYNPTTRIYNFTDLEKNNDFECFGMGPGMGMMGSGPMGYQQNKIEQQQNNGNSTDTQKNLIENREQLQKEREQAFKTMQAELKKYELSSSDIKAGDWIQVSAYPSNTKNIESHMIRVYR